MSYAFYKWLHLAGMALAVMSLAAMAWRAEARRLLSIAHGVGLLVAFVAGFGLLARLGISWPWPGWVLVKLVLWIAVGGLGVLFKRKPELSTPLFWGVWVIFAVAAWLAAYKPF